MCMHSCEKKAYKTLDIYNPFFSGWVKDEGLKVFQKYVFIHYRVGIHNSWFQVKVRAFLHYLFFF